MRANSSLKPNPLRGTAYYSPVDNLGDDKGTK